MNPVRFRFLLGNSNSKKRKRNWDFEKDVLKKEIDVLKAMSLLQWFWGTILRKHKSSTKLLFILSQVSQLLKHRINSLVWGLGIGCGPDMIPSLF